MENYKNENYLQKEIMGQSRHLFIYGDNTDYRSEFLKNIEECYPVVLDSTSPVAIYLNSFGIPKVKTPYKNIEPITIRSMCREYLSFTVALRILERTLNCNDQNLNNRLSRLFRLINVLRNKEYSEISSVTDLIKEMQASQKFYYEKYTNYMNGQIEEISLHDIALPFLELSTFIKYYKQGTNIDSYIGIIFDKKTELSSHSLEAVNSLISGRINSDISIKVATSPTDWNLYRAANGQFIEAVHDYGIVELDNSYKAYTKKLTR